MAETVSLSSEFYHLIVTMFIATCKQLSIVVHRELSTPTEQTDRAAKFSFNSKTKYRSLNDMSCNVILCTTQDPRNCFDLYQKLQQYFLSRDAIV